MAILNESVDAVRPVRLRDIAKLAGVHVTAVSAVLSPRVGNRTRVSDETADRIRELAARLNYRPHFHAQIMRKRKTGLIGLLEFTRSEIHSKRTVDLAKAVKASGYTALISSVMWYDGGDRNSGVREAIDYILNARVEGAILIAPPAQIAPSDVNKIHEAGISCVVFNGVAFEGIPQVRSDAFSGMEMLTQHLLAQGRRKLMLVGAWGTPSKDERTCWAILERVAGFQKIIMQAGGRVVDGIDAWRQISTSSELIGATVIADPLEELLSDPQIGYQAAMQVFEAGKYPDVLVCSNDRFAMGVLRACFEKGLKVPEQIAVTGFAGESDMRFLCPSLTTVDTLAESNAKEAMDLLLEIMQNKRHLRENLILKQPCQLIVRESCGGSGAVLAGV